MYNLFRKKTDEQGKPMRRVMLGIVTLVIVLLSTVQTWAGAKMVVGWIEKVRISPGDLIIHAKLDTGAKHSSLNVPSMDQFERDGEQWVGFEVIDRSGKKTRLERKVFRIAKIKKHEEELQERPVVLLGICLGYIYKEVQVTLVDRSGFDYQMLVGRSFLRTDFLINPAMRYSIDPGCREEPPTGGTVVE